VLFVMLKVLGEPSTSPIVWQKALTASVRAVLPVRLAIARALHAQSKANGDGTKTL